MNYDHVAEARRYQAANGTWGHEQGRFASEADARAAVAWWEAQGEAARYVGRCP